MLGLMDDAEFDVVRGHRRRGDGLLLFTDGLVETAERDISLGIDKLAGLGERLLRAGFDGGAQRLIDRMEQTNDDRALVLVHRRSGAPTPVREPVRDVGSAVARWSPPSQTGRACADVAQW